MKNVNIDQYEFYRIEEQNGIKYLHAESYFYKSYFYTSDEGEDDRPGRELEYCGAEIPLKEFVEKYRDGKYGWFTDWVAEFDQYIGDVSEEELADDFEYELKDRIQINFRDLKGYEEEGDYYSVQLLDPEKKILIE